MKASFLKPFVYRGDEGESTKAQREYIEELLDRAGMTLFDFGYDHDDIDRLTKEQASELIDALKETLGWA